MVCLSVRIQLMNLNAYDASCGEVVAALPHRAPRDRMNGTHTAFFNPESQDQLWPVSHKVWAAARQVVC
jgi:hypothetical protein